MSPITIFLSSVTTRIALGVLLGATLSDTRSHGTSRRIRPSRNRDVTAQYASRCTFAKRSSNAAFFDELFHMPPFGRIGFYAGVAAATAVAAYDVAQILQVIGAVRFPVDETLIFATSLCIVVPFVLEMLALHYSRPVEVRFWTHGGLIFTCMYAVFASANYVIQLSTVIPAKLRGSIDTVRILDQTPHSLLWDFDALAYLSMGLAVLMIIPALGHDGLERRVRGACMAHVAATALAGIVYFYPSYSYKLLMLGLPWGITAPTFMLLAALALRTGLTPSLAG